MKTVIETFIWVLLSQKGEESTHYDNHIVGNITVVIDQWKILSMDSGNYINDIIIWIDRINEILDMWKQTNI